MKRAALILLLAAMPAAAQVVGVAPNTPPPGQPITADFGPTCEYEPTCWDDPLDSSFLCRWLGSCRQVCRTDAPVFSWDHPTADSPQPGEFFLYYRPDGDGWWVPVCRVRCLPRRGCPTEIEASECVVHPGRRGQYAVRFQSLISGARGVSRLSDPAVDPRTGEDSFCGAPTP